MYKIEITKFTHSANTSCISNNITIFQVSQEVGIFIYLDIR